MHPEKYQKLDQRHGLTEFELLRSVINVLNFRLMEEGRSYKTLYKQSTTKKQLDFNNRQLVLMLSELKKQIKHNHPSLKVTWLFIFEAISDFDKINDNNFILYLKILNLLPLSYEKSSLIDYDIILKGLALSAYVLLYFSLNAIPRNAKWAFMKVVEIKNILFEVYGSFEKIEFLSNMADYEAYILMLSEIKVDLLKLFNEFFLQDEKVSIVPNNRVRKRPLPVDLPETPCPSMSEYMTILSSAIHHSPVRSVPEIVIDNARSSIIKANKPS